MLDTNTIVHIKSTKIQKIIKTEFLCAIKATMPSLNIYIYDISSTWGYVNIPKNVLNQKLRIPSWGFKVGVTSSSRYEVYDFGHRSKKLSLSILIT